MLQFNKAISNPNSLALVLWIYSDIMLKYSDTGRRNQKELSIKLYVQLTKLANQIQATTTKLTKVIIMDKYLLRNKKNGESSQSSNNIIV